MLGTNRDKIFEAISSASDKVDFYPNDSDVDIEYSEITTYDSLDTQIVSIGDNEITIMFQAGLTFKHMMKWEEIDGWDEDQNAMHTHTERDDTRELSQLEGMAKIILDPNHGNILSIGCIVFDTDSIEVEAPYIPQHFYHK